MNNLSVQSISIFISLRRTCTGGLPKYSNLRHQQGVDSKGSLRVLNIFPVNLAIHNVSARQFCSSGGVKHSFVAPVPQYDWDYLLCEDHTAAIAENISKRKGVGDISCVMQLWERYRKMLGLDKNICIRSLRSDLLFPEMDIKQVLVLRKQLWNAASSIPNHTHPSTPIGEEDLARQIDLVGTKKEFDFTPKGVIQLGTKLKCLRTNHVGVTTGPRSYYFMGDFARLQDALVQYTLDVLSLEGFQFVYVPEIIHPSLIESCGFGTSGLRHQVFHLYPSEQQHVCRTADMRHADVCLAGTAELSQADVCLAGTAEMPLAGLMSNTTFSHDHLPQKLMTVSRCYRAEAAANKLDKGIYRVHQFNKVEMFGLTQSGQESDDLYQDFMTIQRQIFSQLGLHFRILDMPSTELGAPAYCKFDMETWMPGLGVWGEISSTSNCTDFQSRRLNVQYKDEDESRHFVHTVNGTACAVPRLIMAIAENNQNRYGSIQVPEVLIPYMGMSVIKKPMKHHRLKPLL